MADKFIPTITLSLKEYETLKEKELALNAIQQNKCVHMDDWNSFYFTTDEAAKRVFDATYDSLKAKVKQIDIDIRDLLNLKLLSNNNIDAIKEKNKSLFNRIMEIAFRFNKK